MVCVGGGQEGGQRVPQIGHRTPAAVVNPALRAPSPPCCCWSRACVTAAATVLCCACCSYENMKRGGGGRGNWGREDGT
jgi:hypothetical protein